MASSFRSVVVQVDLEQDATRAGPVAAALARLAGLPIEAVAVAPEAAGHYAQRELERRTAAEGLSNVAGYVLPGDHPGRAIAQHVTHRDGVLLVVAGATWGSSGPYRLDETTEDVLSQMSEPVLVVGPSCELLPTRTATPVVVVDGTGIADAAMPVVAMWARTFAGAPARVVEVVPPAGAPVDAAEDVGHVGPFVDQLTARGVEARGDVLRSHEPSPALVAYAAQFDDAVIVVTSPRWPGEPSHWFNTTRRLIRGATRPVLVVPADRAGYGDDSGEDV
jgi:nucleotide-binding universal stress UspA family protein